MGLMDKIRGLVNGSRNEAPVVKEDKQAKTQLAIQIINLAGKINRINCFYQDVSRFANMRESELANKSIEELERIHDNLNSTYNSLLIQREINSKKNEAVIAAKYTGQRTAEMTNHDLDYAQRGD